MTNLLITFCLFVLFAVVIAILFFKVFYYIICQITNILFNIYDN